MSMKPFVKICVSMLAACACLGACATLPATPAFELTLTLRHHGNATAKSREALYRLSNDSGTRVTGCLTNLFGHTFTQHRDIGAYAVARPTCVREFDLEPGAGIEWIHSIDLSDAPYNAQTLRGWVAVLTPGGCTGKRCRRTDVRSPAVGIP